MGCPPPVTVCQPCKTLLIPEASTHDQPFPRKRESHRDQRGLKLSANQGCFICNRIWERLDLVDDKAAPDYKDPLSFWESLEDAWPRGATIYHPDPRDRDHLLEIVIDSLVFRASRARTSSIFFILKPLDESSMTDIVKRLPESTKSLETLSMAEEWISDCVKNHPKCNDTDTERDWYPTRLLDCGSQTDTDPRCTLVETKTNAVTGPYMTLSHCWGLADCMKLTTDNYGQMVRGIPSSQLPQLYQDALYVARSLGVRYLWIDSLCIIQKGDNLADWNHEVTLLSEVYSRSLCNISASDAPDATHSLFCTRSANSYFPETIECTFDGAVSRYAISENEFWATEVTRALVNTRAWVLQERLLARRILHFGKRHLVWECREALASDASPRGLPNSGVSSELLLKSSFPRPDLSRRPSGPYRSIWSSIVYLYANCDLTFPGDRLVALSALARSMGKLTRDGYVAGMWRGDLELEMLWYIVDTRADPSPTTYVAPTWSWVASTGHLFPSDDVSGGQSLMKVEEVQLDYVTDDTWGMLRGGWLHLRGHLKKLSLIDPEDWKMVVNGIQVETVTEYHMRPNIYLDAPNDERNKASESNLYCMLARRGESKLENVVAVLLLELVDGETGTFKRIGLARGEVKDPQATFINPSGEEDEFPCLEYADGQHLIRII